MTAVRRRKLPPVQQSLPLSMPEGIHLRLPQHVYFDVRALGSSDFSVLAADPRSWWYGSPYNPHRRERKKRQAELMFGSALHALMLEGEAAYRARFVVQPDADRSDWARKREEVRKLLRERRIEIPRGDFSDTTLWRLVRQAGLQNRVYDVANADYIAARKAGKDVITEDEDRRLRHMAKLVQEHEDFGPNLQYGLSEVSIFWRRPDRPDILLRARWDKMIPGIDLDLKSFSNSREKAPDEATFDSIADNDYDLQAEHYRDAHEHLQRFVREGRIHAWAPGSQIDGMESAEVLSEDRARLRAIAAVKEWRWVWLFYQVRNDNAGQERAPVIVPWWTWPRGQMFDQARVVIDRALTNYAASVSEFGLHNPWSEIRRIEPLPIEKLKRLAFKRSAQ